ncbi:MAG: hypothetical protein KBA03_01205 [Anaerolineaceae bacterium]|nr:hypothetical protein [Anaerolineaceae bacterium]
METRKLNKSRIFSLLSLSLVVILLIGACNVIAPTAPKGDPVEAAMQTLQAQATQDYYNTLVAQVATQQTLVPQATLDPTNINQVPGTTQEPAVPTIAITVPANTAVPPTAVPPTVVLPTNTAVPPTPTPKPCLQITFVSDISIPDGTKLTGGENFTKIWRLQNSGTCVWDTQFDVVFVKGDQLGANPVYDIPKAVKPGETVDISIPMVAPYSPGKYRSEWQLRSSNNVYFGLGSDSKQNFWADIESIDSKGVVYNFADKAGSAKWTNGLRNTLKFPGNEKDTDSGYVVVKGEPVRENGVKENEIGMITRPNRANDGYIQGVYPAIDIKDGDRFQAALMCEGGATDCSVKFEVYYQYDGIKATSLGTWKETFDGNWTTLNADLSFLAGRKVTFNLVVWNDGSITNNRALWLNPRIQRTK